MRREHKLRVNLNGRTFNSVIIDSHYEIRHSKTINDLIILKLVSSLEGVEHRSESTLHTGFEIYVTDPIFIDTKSYRLIWTVHPNEDYIGVINAFRRNCAKLSK